jgi:hypothetical protein
MGSSENRDLYFRKEIENQVTPEAYLSALANSPYRTHRRMAERLQEQYKQLSLEREQSIEMETQLEDTEENSSGRDTNQRETDRGVCETE